MFQAAEPKRGENVTPRFASNPLTTAESVIRAAPTDGKSGDSPDSAGWGHVQLLHNGAFIDADAKDYAGMESEFLETTEHGHGRVETRCYRTLGDLSGRAAPCGEA